MLNRDFILFIGVTVIFITYVIFDALFDEEMWIANTSFTKDLQSQQSTFEDLIFNFFSAVVFIVPLISLYSFLFENNKLDSILYMGLLTISVTMNEVLKQIYHQPRPYMVETDIHSSKCNSDYGKPSGHAQNSIVMIVLMIYMLFPELLEFQAKYNQIYEPAQHSGYTIESQQQLSEALRSEAHTDDIKVQSKTKIAIKIMIIIVLIIGIFMTGWSRIYFGVHSFGQVLLGWVYGLYFCFIYLQFHDQIKIKIQTIIELNNNRKSYFYLIPISIILLLVFLGVDIVLLEMNIHSHDEREDTLIYLAQINKCNNSSYTITSPQILYNSSFLNSGICIFVTGLIVGGIKVKGTYNEGVFKDSFWKLGMKSKIQRIVFLIAPLLCLSPLIFVSTNDVFEQLFLQIIPAAFSAGLIITWLYPKILDRMSLQINGDLFLIGKLLTWRSEPDPEVSLEQRNMSQNKDFTLSI